MRDRFHFFLSDTNRILIFCYSLFISIIYFIFNDGWQYHPDSYDYIQGLEVLKNGGEWYDEDIAFRPGAVYLSFPLTLLFNNVNSIGIHNLIIYFLFGNVFYSFTNKITNDKDISFWSTLLLISSFPILYWGISILNDLGGWFFLLLSIFLIIQLFDKDFESKFLIFSALVLGFGVLYKPTVLPSAIFFTIWLFIQRKEIGISKSIIIWLKFTFISLLPLIVNTFIINYFWGYDFSEIVEKEFFGKSDTSLMIGFKYTYTYKFLTLLIVFPFLPIFFFYSKDFFINLNDFRNKQLLVLLASCFLWFLFSSLRTASPRYAFILFPVIYIWLGAIYLNMLTSVSKKFNTNIDKLRYSILILITLVNLLIIINDKYIRESIGIWYYDV